MSVLLTQMRAMIVSDHNIVSDCVISCSSVHLVYSDVTQSSPDVTSLILFITINENDDNIARIFLWFLLIITSVGIA